MKPVRLLASIYLTRQFVRFSLVGLAALVLHWTSRILINTVVDCKVALVLAYCVGMGSAFVLNKRFVFPYGSRPLREEMLFFFGVNIAAFPFVWIVAYVLGEIVFSIWLPHAAALALGHGIAITLPVFATYVLHKFVTFREA